jgi:hypothetical protein
MFSQYDMSTRVYTTVMPSAFNIPIPIDPLMMLEPELIIQNKVRAKRIVKRVLPLQQDPVFIIQRCEKNTNNGEMKQVRRIERLITQNVVSKKRWKVVKEQAIRELAEKGVDAVIDDLPKTRTQNKWTVAERNTLVRALKLYGKDYAKIK